MFTLDHLKNFIPPSIKFYIKKIFKWFFYAKNSYSQCGEDIIIESIFASKGLKNISYLDIGANHPYYISNTAKFYKSNNVRPCILIEPNIVLASLLKRARPNDVVLNIGISPDETAKLLKFYIMNADVLSTFSKEEAEVYEKMGYKLVDTVEIECYSINKILVDYYSDIELNLLNIDVEGLDFEIIKSINFNLHRPNVICVETVKYRELNLLQRNWEIINFLLEQNYSIYAQNYVNTIFVDSNYMIKVV